RRRPRWRADRARGRRLPRPRRAARMRPPRRHPLPAADDRPPPAGLHRGTSAPPDRSCRIPQRRQAMKSPLAERDRDRLIEAMLPDVAFDGWSHAALRVAANAGGIALDEAEALFP